MTDGRRTKSDGNSSHDLEVRWAKNETNINETIFLTWDNNPQIASGLLKNL